VERWERGPLVGLGVTTGLVEGRNDFGDVARKIKAIAESKLVQIMDMDREEDMGGAMLISILRKERQCGCVPTHRMRRACLLSPSRAMAVFVLMQCR
jgi:hypothetical protein